MIVVVYENGVPLAFADERERIEVHAAAGVPEAFARVDAALAAGRYVAGFASYELGRALVPRQASAPAGDLPLLAFGVYDAPRAAPPNPAASPPAFRLGPLVPAVSAARYARDLARIASAIGDGDVYQVNYAVPFEFSFAGDPFALFASVQACGAYPHAAYVERDAYALLSWSPESFVRFELERIVTKPMKGTAAPNDRAALANAKNRAEHVMIVDLLRNDLHRLGAEVRVERFAEREDYATFSTLTSTIAAAVARPALGEVFGALFPCGSVTGAPKVAAMATIAEREGRPRGIFCGSIGFVRPDRTGAWNVAIRTAQIDRASGRGRIHIGGGIVADSDARDEWAEIVVKRRFLDGRAPRYALLETFRREADGTYRNLAAHLARLARSADALHVAYDEAAIRARLAHHARVARRHVPGETLALVRVRLALDGTLQVSERTEPAVAQARLTWSREVLDPREPLRAHKTTWRPEYDRASAEASAGDAFDAILCSTSGEVADCARTTVFVAPADGGALLTPRLASGALPGILRAGLLASGRAREARLRPDDLRAAAALYVGNSARGLIRATLAERDAPVRASAG